MCGIAGSIILSSEDKELDFNRIEVEMMTDMLRHRGPDCKGLWTSEDKKITLGHRRLSIIDLSENGSQPMKSKCGNFIITFNGEIYNYLELKKAVESEHKNFPWKGNSDTEVLLEACSKLGIDRTLDMVEGMFAFAIFDLKKHQFFLARDRLGEKPLYYSFSRDRFIFSSEIKSFSCISSLEKDISINSLGSFLEKSFISEDKTIFRGINKLQPANLLKFNLGSNDCSISRYWDPIKYTTSECLFSGSRADAKERLIELLENSIKKQMVSDVPIGAFLSGGIDSSLIVSLMQKLSNEPVKTFSIGFNEKNFNEANHAKTVSKFVGTDHCEEYFTPDDLINLVEKLPEIYDEPFADASQLPTILLSRITKKKVTVSLSGDGGDELFGGYNRHIWTSKLSWLISFVPYILRFNLLKLLESKFFLNVFYYLKNIIKLKDLDSKVLKFFRALQARDLNDLYNLMISNRIDSSKILKKESITQEETDKLNVGDFRSPQDLIMYRDLNCYLPDDILVKVDRASMSCSLESRVPFLNRDLVEFALSLPKEFKFDSFGGKSILKEILYENIPRHIVERPKTGFSVPIASWLRGDLKSWSAKYFSAEYLENQNIFEVEPTIKLFNDHQDESIDNSQEIWNILMFQVWHEYWQKNLT